jgi:hypothetical protein
MEGILNGDTILGNTPNKDVRAKPWCLFSAEAPLKWWIRSKKYFEVYYGFGDASHDGFGLNMQFGENIKDKFDQWCDEVAEKPSNYRELLNSILRLEELVKKEKLCGIKFIYFHRQMTAESVYCKGNLSSK